MQEIPGKLSYANVVATLALFLVLAGGSAFAASSLSKELRRRQAGEDANCRLSH
jgi:hypothetical protein